MAHFVNQATRALEPVACGLVRSDLIEIYNHMLLARALSERMWLLNRTGRAHIIVTCEGHEAAQVGSAYAMRKGHDFALPYYRDLGVVLTLGMTAKEVMLGTLNRAADPNSGGKQMPSHWSHPELRIVSHSSVVATHLPHAVGIAHAARIKGEDSVAVVYFGDGAASKGDFHESLNWAGVHRLPVVFICENNGYAISVPSSKQTPVPQVADRAEAYGLPGITVDGTDAIAAYEATREALARARKGEGSSLIELMTYRFAPHTNNDDDSLYRSREEVEAWKERDPLLRMKSRLLETGAMTVEEDMEIQIQVQQEVDDAEAFADASPLPKSEDALLHVYGATS